ncbi:MAG: hypothetical protein JST70_13740 [Bacteroidetes bacterium]|nr:hypothetical protein [Bacteroidota bacterium]
MFFQRDILIATSHKKEAAIAPVLRERFQSKIIVPGGFNTDRFGTFTGEIERIHSPLDAARKKCAVASKTYNAGLVIASEGSFGPHPTLFFVPADDEILLLTDYENDLEIAVREISTQTNFSGKEVKTAEEVKDFAQAIGFPDHKIILRKAERDNAHIVKDIANWEELLMTAEMFMNRYDSFFIETDMRAMNNPTRMSVITQAAKKLAGLMASKCPGCQVPGFDVGEVVPGLPCSLCSAPTKSTLKKVYVCKKCNYSKEVYYPNKKRHEEPMFCDWCNP